MYYEIKLSCVFILFPEVRLVARIQISVLPTINLTSTARWSSHGSGSFNSISQSFVHPSSSVCIVSRAQKCQRQHFLAFQLLSKRLCLFFFPATTASFLATKALKKSVHLIFPPIFYDISLCVSSGQIFLLY